MKTKFVEIIKWIFDPLISISMSIRDKVKKSIRFELIIIFAMCLLVAILIGGASNKFLELKDKRIKIDYSQSIGRISDQLKNIANNINEKNISISAKFELQQILNQYKHNENYKILICNLEGNVMYKSDNASDTQVDIYNTIKSFLENKSLLLKDTEYKKEYRSFYPLKFNDGRGYVIIIGELNAKIVYEHDIDAKLPAVIISFLSFLIIFYFITNKKMKYIEIVSIGLLEISKGNLDYRIKKYGNDELGMLADNINYMAEELKTKIESERKAEKTKNDLITNVSHDLRTPLTSIKGYLELIKNKKYIEENQLDQYANVSYNQAEKLELLINDLFEYTKLANNAVKFDKQNIALNELLDQLIEELVPIFENTTVTISKEFIKEKVIVNVDPNKIARVFENILINAIRYSLRPSAIRVILTVNNGFSLVSIQNKCEKISDDNLSKIFDRFYRVEQSRSSNTGGSGLGLAIAKSMVELQGGFIEAKYADGYISFNVKFKIINE
ncbi:sensor histidine kinase [Clostridium sp. FP1]|uniref:sensor histidine kinase n=1 Tax=Clostridium sp. FP1 TaxID=2724076 RepID=UPI001CCD0005|nr:ATP-binding protein [Clostridium sp. FP1]MBZ9634403.1 cell wall metabolism sensor histidine kinase WalK [Clostridium sp. FP1]